MAGNLELLGSVLAAAKDGRAALIGYLPAGFPSVDGGVDAMTAMIEGGCDIVEVGLPHSDPVLDGPVIQTADDIALRGGVKIRDVIRTVGEVHARTGAPILCMTYWNPVDRYGVERFAADLAEAGGAGCILPICRSRSRSGGRPPSSTVWRPCSWSRPAAVMSGWRRSRRRAAVSSTRRPWGVTGTRESVGQEARELVERTRRTTTLPVCVGLGGSNATQATEVAAFADGVIVGSAFVKRLLDAEGDTEAGLAGLRELAGELAEGVRAAR
ncbi:Tryptophan synthase alpha chain OS=Streptomyces antimycoticus OX=68175 GN=trpA PE=3 SV=1 [Streptomyces antimycoticus]